MTGYVLHYAPDNASLIVRLALEAMCLPYQTRLVDRAAQGQRARDYLRLNPAGRIPVLETPAGPIFETAAILLWLADRHGSLFPAAEDPARGAALSWLMYLANTPHAAMVTVFYPDRFVPQTCWSDLRARQALRIAESMALVEAASHPVGPFFAGVDLSLIDLYVAALLRWPQLYPVSGPRWLDTAALPRLMRSALALEGLPCVQALCVTEGMAAHPFTQPEYPSPPEGSAL